MLSYLVPLAESRRFLLRAKADVRAYTANTGSPPRHYATAALTAPYPHTHACSGSSQARCMTGWTSISFHVFQQAIDLRLTTPQRARMLQTNIPRRALDSFSSCSPPRVIRSCGVRRLGSSLLRTPFRRSQRREYRIAIQALLR